MEKENGEKIFCQFCGKRLPADILSMDGRLKLLVVCPKCKHKNTIERQNI